MTLLCRIKHRWRYSPDRNFRRCKRCLTLQVADYWERAGWSDFQPTAVQTLLWDERDWK